MDLFEGKKPENGVTCFQNGLRLHPETYQGLKLLADKEQLTMADIARLALRDYVKLHNGSKQ